MGVISTKKRQPSDATKKFQEVGRSIELYLNWLASASDPSDDQLQKAVCRWRKAFRTITRQESDR
jgi:hypothetical protein